MAATDVVSSLQREVEIVKEGLKSVDEDIKKLTGRDPSESRGQIGNRRISLKRNFGERIGGPAQKRFNVGSAYSRLGSRLSNDREQHYGQLESDGEEEEDDGKKPTLQSSVVATPAPSRLKQDTVTNVDKKTQTRNKRMFGVLLGTLQKFKESSGKEAAREKRRLEIEKKLEEAAAREREQASRQRKELFFARKEKQTKLEDLERKMEVAEMLEDWEAHDRKLAKFIRTKTKPHIFYLPAKQNDHTLGLLEKTAKLLEGDIKKRRKEVEDVLQKSETEVNEVEQKQQQDDWETHEEDQETGGKQDLGVSEEREDEGDVGMRREKVEGDGSEKVEGEVNNEIMEEEQNERETRRGDGDARETREAIEVNEKKGENLDSEIKEEKVQDIQDKEEKQENSEVQEMMQPGEDSVNDKQEDSEMQIDMNPNNED